MDGSIESIEWDDDVTLDVYKPLYDSKAVINLLWGGRDSGKSFNLPHILIYKCLTQSKFRCVLLRSTYESIEDSQYEEIKDFVETHDLEHLFTFTKKPLRIKCVNGNDFIARGENKPKKLKSIKNPTDCWAEEMDQIKEDTFDYILTSLRATGVLPQMWASFNPETNEDGDNWIRERFFDSDLYESDYFYNHFREWDQAVKGEEGDTVLIKHISLHTTCDVNPYCDEIRRALYDSYKHTNENKWRVWRKGWWGIARTGLEYYNIFNRKAHVRKVDVDERYGVHAAFDFNVVPYMTGQMWQIIPKTDKEKMKLVCLKEYCLKSPRNTIQDVVDDMIRDYQYLFRNGIFVYGDASGKNRLPLRDQRDYYSEIIKAFKGYVSRADIRLPSRNPLHRDQGKGSFGRRTIMNQILAGQHKFEIVIHESCVTTIKDFEKVQTAPDGGKMKKMKKEGKVSFQELGHTSDSADYFVMEFKRLYFPK